MKGIILAGGLGTRLMPLTKAKNKHTFLIYDKPMIFYPLSILMLMNVKNILIISDKKAISDFKNLLGNGKDFGIKISYEIQNKPKGIVDAFRIGKNFIKASKRNVLVLGDNLFFGSELQTVFPNILNKNQLCIYYDIELVNSMVLEDFKQFPQSSPQIITVIGLVVVFLDEIFEIKHFVVNGLNQKDEAKNFRKFIKYIKKDICQKQFPNEPYTFYHYSSAEHSFIKKMFQKNPLIKNEDIDFYIDNIEKNSFDLLKIVKEDNITPADTFGKGLKPIAKGFYKANKIPEKWENSDIDGENSMVYTKKAYQSKEGKNHPFMQEVIKYNKIDCLVMFFIVFYWKYKECYFLDYD